MKRLTQALETSRPQDCRRQVEARQPVQDRRILKLQPQGASAEPQVSVARAFRV